MEQHIKNAYERWREKASPSVKGQLYIMKTAPETIEDAFYRDLEFGTGGLRGVLGAGTNRMNVHTVAKASQGLANYIVKKFVPQERSVAISYDSRLQSDEFARVAASVFAANGIQVWIYPELMPTPCLSFATRELHCSAGVMITASHNPAKYNGYKVYGADGCQITLDDAAAVLAEIDQLDVFDDVKAIPFEEALSLGHVRYISEAVTTAYIEAVKTQSVLGNSMPVNKDIPIVYSPLNGTGLKPVMRVLRESGYTNVTVVKEQEQPDGNFPTCPYPNPEIPEAMALGIEYAKKHQAELLLATDPDSDRIGLAVRDDDGAYQLLTGNEVGLLLMEYICSHLMKSGTMPKKPIFIKTIVTSDLAEQIADRYGVESINVLTGFKYIGEQIGLLEQQGRSEDYIFGFEESCGYLKGSYVRDKDAVVAALLVCDMFAYYRSQNVSLLEKLEELYQTYGYCLNHLLSYEYPGAAGAQKIKDFMADFRGGIENIGNCRVLRTEDYAQGLEGLPKANVLKLYLEGNGTAIIRPSGTEPKLKVYLSVRRGEYREALAGLKQLRTSIDALLTP